MTKEVDKDSKAAKKFTKQQEEAKSNTPVLPSGGGSSKRGLSGLMGVISGKKQKMGCLDKSKLDWDKYVAEEGIKEDLQSHNRGKDG